MSLYYVFDFFFFAREVLFNYIKTAVSLKCCVNLFLHNASIVTVQLCLKNVLSQVEVICLFRACIIAIEGTQNKYAIKLE